MKEYKLTASVGLGRKLIIGNTRYDTEAKTWKEVCSGSKEAVTDRAHRLLKEERYRGKKVYILVRWKRNHKGKWNQDKVWRIE